MQKYVIIVAGGKGLRFGSEIPKQFLLLCNKPVLMHTINAFYTFNSEIKIILVLPIEHFEYWNSLCREYNFTLKHQLVEGGNERFYSVRNGINAIAEDGIIAIHDGVRPLVSHQTLTRCFNTASQLGNATPVVELTDSIRHINNHSSKMVNRNEFKLVQTPQVFKSEILKQAFEQSYSPLFTDDASVVENQGITINLVEGNNENIKITGAMDLEFAQCMLSKKIS